MKPSTGAAVRLHRNAVRDRPESLSAFKWNACPPSPEYPQIDMVMDTPSNSLPQVRDGRVKAYAVGAKARIAAAPDIPTVDEAGLPGFYASNWYAVWAPKGTPTDVVARLNSAMVHALADPAVRQRIGDLGLEVPDRDRQTPEALGAFQKAEIEKWWPIVKAAGIKGE
jgi:tripartite-type tricarboxylate transporter receptor subunit TctC